jgi:Fe-S-cluster containining protein
MNLSQLFRSYELLVDKADRSFREMQQDYGECVSCERHCSDCCNAVFGLFIIEAAYLKRNFDQLGKEEIKAALRRCNEADRALKQLEKMLLSYRNDPNMQAYAMARERLRCPLLDDNLDCILHSFRPITCRVYGIPTRIQGKARVCGKSGFKKGVNYPAFDLDGVYRDLYNLSGELLKNSGITDIENASLLVSVSKTISTPFDILINEIFAKRGEDG